MYSSSTPEKSNGSRNMELMSHKTQNTFMQYMQQQNQIYRVFEPGRLLDNGARKDTDLKILL